MDTYEGLKDETCKACLKNPAQDFLMDLYRVLGHTAILQTRQRALYNMSCETFIKTGITLLGGDVTVFVQFDMTNDGRNKA